MEVYEEPLKETAYRDKMIGALLIPTRTNLI